MKVAIEELQAYLLDCYRPIDRLSQLGNELADVIHYAVAIAALNGLSLNDFILSKDRKASIRYHHRTNLEQFILDQRASGSAP